MAFQTLRSAAVHFIRTQDFENVNTNVSRNKRIKPFNKGGVVQMKTLKVISYTFAIVNK